MIEHINLKTNGFQSSGKQTIFLNINRFGSYISYYMINTIFDMVKHLDDKHSINSLEHYSGPEKSTKLQILDLSAIF